MELDIETSRRIAKRMRSKLKVKQCYGNSVRAMEYLPDSIYVEGYAVIPDRTGRGNPGMVIEHGWLEDNGMIIDVTLQVPGTIYEPGLRFNRYELARAIVETPEGSDHLPIFFRFGWGGSDSREMMNANKRAFRHVGYEMPNPFDEE